LGRKQLETAARAIGQRYCDKGVSGKEAPVPGRCNHCRAALECEVSSDENDKVLATGFPGMGLQSSVAGSAVNVQFMVKDSKKYAASGGWGYADFTNGNPGNEALHQACFPCHQPVKDRDFVFTRYAPTP